MERDQYEPSAVFIPTPPSRDGELQWDDERYTWRVPSWRVPYWRAAAAINDHHERGTNGTRDTK